MANRGPLARAVLFAAVAVCLSVAGLTGCGSGESNGPKVLPSLSGHPSPSASLPAVPTLGPSPSVEEIKASAEAFVRRYYALLNLTTRDASKIPDLAAMASPDCQLCQHDIAGRRSLAQRHQTMTGPGYQLSRVDVGDPEGLATTADVQVSIGPGTVVDEASKVVGTITASGPSQSALSLAYGPSGWRVIDLIVFPA